MPGTIDFVADTHVHLYEGFDLPLLLTSARANFRVVAPSALPRRMVLCLTERVGCNVFRELASARGAASEALARSGYTVSPTGEDCSIRIGSPDGEEVVLLAGRRIATRERLELLVLATGETIPDGLSLKEAIDAARQLDGVLVLNWSPGKWMFSKYPIVRNALEQLRPGVDFLGDVAMRPYGWGEPELFRLGRERGVQLLAGSDPLPLPGEERMVGCYGVAGRMAGDDAPARAFLSALRNGPAGEAIMIVGARTSPLSTIRRFVQNRGQTMYRPPSEFSAGSPSLV